MLFSITILAISLSLDAFGVGVAYGIRKIKIPFIPKLLICFFSILYSGLSLILGKSLSAVLPIYISKFIGVGILALMGLYIIIQNIKKSESGSNSLENYTEREKTLFKVAIKSLGITIQVIKNPDKGDIDRSGSIDIKESILLGFALSVDAIGVGIGSALAGFHSMAIPISVGLFQLAFLYIGTFLGEKFSLMGKLNKKVISLLPGILLISLAILKIR
jgi:putative sporulation protein YtaF